jgi:hypothetical protein
LDDGQQARACGWTNGWRGARAEKQRGAFGRPSGGPMRHETSDARTIDPDDLLKVTASLRTGPHSTIGGRMVVHRIPRNNPAPLGV